MNEMRKAIEAAAITPSERDDEGTIVRTFCFDTGFLGFAGHFPGFPIVPAIVQVLAAQLLVEAAHGDSLRLVSVESAKFLKQLLPGDEIRIACQPKAGAPAVYQSMLVTEGGTAASFQLRFDSEKGR